jgi:hypothetical protein
VLLRTEVARDHRDEAKVEAFEISKFFQVWEESTKAREEQQLPLDPAGEIWTVEKISRPGGSVTEERTGERIWTIGSWSNYPSAVGSDRSYTRFKLREQEGESPERHWRIGYQHSGYRKSRRQEIGNLQGENPKTHQSRPSIWDTWQRLTSKDLWIEF